MVADGEAVHRRREAWARPLCLSPSPPLLPCLSGSPIPKPRTTLPALSLIPPPPVHISGDMKHGVPVGTETMAPSMLSSQSRALPKSDTLTLADMVSRRLSGCKVWGSVEGVGNI